MRYLIKKASKYEINKKAKNEEDFYFICDSEGIEIIWSNGKFSWYMTVDDVPFIVLSRKKRGLKLLFDMYHELGHHFGHYGDVPNQVFFSGLKNDKAEIEADAFATVCLIPEDKIDNFDFLEDHPVKFARRGFHSARLRTRAQRRSFGDGEKSRGHFRERLDRRARSRRTDGQRGVQ